MTQEECIQAREINATHQRASRAQHALLFVSTVIGELRVIQEQVDHHHLPPMEEVYQFCQAVNWKDETANSCCRSGKVVLAPLHVPPQEFKWLSKIHCFYQGQFLQQHLCIDICGCLQKIPRLMSNWQTR
jgi:hypothetical protein